MKQLSIILAVALCATASPVLSQDFVTDVSNNGTNSAAFLEIGVGARAEAMGGAYTAQEGFMEAIYWNPAGLAYVDGVGVSFTHTNWLADLSYDFIAISTPLPVFNSVLGASFVTLQSPEQPVRTEYEPLGTGEFYETRDYAATLSLSARIIEQFSVGLSGKLIGQRIWSESGTQLALDAGVYYRTPLDGMSIGASISNFGGDLSLDGKNLNDVIDPDLVNVGIDNIPVTYNTTRHPLPQIFRFGLAYTSYALPNSSLVASVDLQHPSGATESINSGLEYGFNEILFLRIGYQHLFERDSIRGLTLGGGIQYRLQNRSRFVFDYAWSDWGILQQAHRFSLNIYV